MIQRIQSLYLLLTTLLSLLFLNGPILSFINTEGKEIYLKAGGIFTSAGTGTPESIEKLIPLLILIILIPLISILAIFLFKQRKIQMKVTLALVILILIFTGAGAFYSFRVIQNYDAMLVPGYRMIIPVVLLVLSVMAYRGVKKDEELVRSYDRLR